MNWIYCVLWLADCKLEIEKKFSYIPITCKIHKAVAGFYAHRFSDTGVYLLSIAALPLLPQEESSYQFLFPRNLNSLVYRLVSWLEFEPSTPQSSNHLWVSIVWLIDWLIENRLLILNGKCLEKNIKQQSLGCSFLSLLKLFVHWNEFKHFGVENCDCADAHAAEDSLWCNVRWKEQIG